MDKDFIREVEMKGLLLGLGVTVDKVKEENLPWMSFQNSLLSMATRRSMAPGFLCGCRLPGHEGMG